MAWAFRKRIKVIPGVYINLSKSGISANTGVRGASLTFRSDGVYRNLGLPGTGIYSRQKVGDYGGRAPDQGTDQEFAPDEAFEVTAPDYSFISADPLEVTSEGLQGLQQAVINANRQKQELTRDAESIKGSLSLLRLGGGFVQGLPDLLLRSFPQKEHPGRNQGATGCSEGSIRIHCGICRFARSGDGCRMQCCSSKGSKHLRSPHALLLHLGCDFRQ